MDDIVVTQAALVIPEGQPKQLSFTPYGIVF